MRGLEIPNSDRVLECATSKNLDFSKHEDVVKALFHAYTYMYLRAGNDVAEAILSKYYELVGLYDTCTGKPKNISDDKKCDETPTGFRLERLEKAVGRSLKRIDDIYLAIGLLKRQGSIMDNELDMLGLRVERLENGRNINEPVNR